MSLSLKPAKLATSVAALTFALAAGTANAATTNLRIQTHFSQETLSGQLAKEYIEDIQKMSNGEIKVEMFYASAVVKSAETFDAAGAGGRVQLGQLIELAETYLDTLEARYPQLWLPTDKVLVEAETDTEHSHHPD